MDDAGQELAGDLIHIRDHQKKTLGSCIGGGESAGRERTVNGTCRACLRLHLHDLYTFAEDVLEAGGGPCVGQLSHNARRSDRIDGGDFGKRIRHSRGGRVTVHGYLFSFDCHVFGNPPVY